MRVLLLAMLLLAGCATRNLLVGKCIELTMFDRTCWGTITDVVTESESFVIKKLECDFTNNRNRNYVTIPLRELKYWSDSDRCE